jgi:hypothetical protein
VTKLRYALLGGLVAASIAVIVLVFAGRGDELSSTPSLPTGKAISADASVIPQSHLFGELIHVEVDAVVDRRRLDPNRLRLRTHWTPYQAVGPLQRTRSDVGELSKLRWDADLQCVVVECAPAAGSAVRRRLNTSTIVYAGTLVGGGRFDAVKISWPEVNLFSRLDPIDLERRASVVSRRGTNVQLRALRPPWRVTTAPLGATAFRISPTTLFWTALLLSLLAVAGAGMLMRPWLPHFAAFRRQPPRTPLEHALDAVDQARGGMSTEERKALELLAVELRRTGRGELAWAATELAWSTAAPPAEQTGALTAAVRRELAGRTNGHRG